MNLISGLLAGVLANANTVLGVVGNAVVRVAGGIFQRMLGLITGAATGAFQFLLAVPGRVLSLFGTLGGAITNAIGGAVGIVSRLLGTVLAGAAITLGVAIGGLVAAMTKGVQTANQWGRSVGDLSNSMGIGAAGAGGVIGRFGALGVRPEGVQGMFGDQNPIALRSMSRAYGLPDFDSPGFAQAIASAYQRMQASGPMGQLQARAMLGNMGMDNAEGRRIAMTPVDQIQRSIQFQQNTQAAFGIDNAAIVETSRNFELLTTRLSILGQSALTAIGSRALPRINGMLEGFSELALRHAASMGEFMNRAVDASFDAIQNFATFMYADFPSMILGAGVSVLDFAGTIVNSVPRIFDSFLGVVDLIQNAFTSIGDNVVPMLEDLWARIADTGHSAFDGILGALDRIAAHPLVQMVMRAIPGLAEIGAMAQGARNTGRDVARGLGASDGVANVVGLATPFALMAGARALVGHGVRAVGRAVLGTVTGGGAAGVGGPGVVVNGGGLMGFIRHQAGNVVRTVAQSPVGRVLAAGVGLGVMGYEGLRRTGIISRDRPAALEAAANAWGRTRDFFTGNAGHYDRMMFERNNPHLRLVQQGGQWVSVQRTRPPSEVLARTARQVENTVRGVARDARNVVSRTVRQATERTAQNQQRGQRGSWARGIQERAGASVAGGATTAGAAIRGLRDDLANRLSKEDPAAKQQELQTLMQIRDGVKALGNKTPVIRIEGDLAKVLAQATAYIAEDIINSALTSAG